MKLRRFFRTCGLLDWCPFCDFLSLFRQILEITPIAALLAFARYSSNFGFFSISWNFRAKTVKSKSRIGFCFCFCICFFFFFLYFIIFCFCWKICSFLALFHQLKWNSFLFSRKIFELSLSFFWKICDLRIVADFDLHLLRWIAFESSSYKLLYFGVLKFVQIL